MNKLYIEKIDALRGIAILLVLSYHTLLIICPNFEAKTYSDSGFLIINNIKSLILTFNPIGQGAMGVELFLVISGFLIHLNYLKNGSSFSAKEFFSKRFWRIYPPYFLVLIFFSFMQKDFSLKGFFDIITHVFFVHNLSNRTFFAINPSFWSLALEFQLYLIYPLYLVLLKYFSASKTTIIVLSLNLALSIFGCVSGYNSLTYTAFVLKFWIVWCSGAFLADRYYNKKRIFYKPFVWFLLFYALFLSFKLFKVTSFFMLLPASLTCLALIETFLQNESLSRFTINRLFIKVLTFIGLISYSIYLIHQPILEGLIQFYKPSTEGPIINTVLGVTLAYLTIILISYLFYKLIELRSISFGQKIRKKGLLSTNTNVMSVKVSK
ncbi:MAG: acyltransferase [Sporocytophaga sp.]|uniref:acyltransferase family protein n=1 Tax=Sporocytophaga sp. TaxID=2231183 RepID=UPI001B2810E9|nr:acyltransferase [Sporocytophaga sp.]MBO9699677.1 acyltransferase [Sporocytophaga sp.]